MTAISEFLDFLWTSFLLLGPMLMLGLFLAGLIHVLISRAAILKWLRHDSLGSVATAAAIGVPMPLCSCSVVPVVGEMRRKGASRSSCMSFLITAPETGADSILVTHAYFGFVAAVARPLVSFVTAVVTGVFCIGLIRDDGERRDDGEPRDDETSHDHDHDHDHCDHDHGDHVPLIAGQDDCYVAPRQLMAALRRALARLGRPKRISWVKPAFYRRALAADAAPLAAQAGAPAPAPQEGSPPAALPAFKTIARHVLRYGFVEVADEILFALLVGVLLGGVLYLAIPGDLMASEYARWLAYPVMVLVGVPLYICASASTPIAAALVAKGFSPGAALVFLMTGPATNTGTIAIIVSQFGARFASIYVGSVVAVTVLLGIAIDVALVLAGWSLTVNLDASDSAAIAVLQWSGALGLIALIAWRFRAGALKSGYEDLISNVRPLAAPLKAWWSRVTRGRPAAGVLSLRTPLGRGVWGVALLVFVGSGFVIVPPGSVGYGRLFGEVVWRDKPPGLHYFAPRPFMAADAWPVREVKSLMSEAPLEYLSGDLNLLALSVDVQYRVRDPYLFHYRTQAPERILADAVQARLRAFVAAHRLDDLLNAQRVALEDEVRALFEQPQPATPLLAAVALVKVGLRAIHPVAEAMNSFREISSSQEDRERIVVDAQRFMVSLVPQAHGNAVYETQQAEGAAFRKTTESAAEAEAIRTVSAAVRTAPVVLQNMLWRERMETALANREKIIVPSRRSQERFALWKRRANQSGNNHAHD